MKDGMWGGGGGGKRTFAYCAATLFNCLDTDLKQIACVSPCIIYSSRLNNFKHKLFILFLKFASNVSHLEEFMCYDCRFSLYCNRIRRQLVYIILYLVKPYICLVLFFRLL